jgi:uncharacterized membrane protein
VTASTDTRLDASSTTEHENQHTEIFKKENETEANQTVNKEKEQEVNETLKSLTERLSAALSTIIAKEELVKQHAKVAEEAIAGKSVIHKNMNFILWLVYSDVAFKIVIYIELLPSPTILWYYCTS